MNNSELALQKERIAKYEALSRAEAEVLAALKLMEHPDPSGPFTGNANRVQSVTAINIQFRSAATVEMKFETSMGLIGWEVAAALSAPLRFLADRLARAKEKI